MPYQNILETGVNGVYRIQPRVFSDERGWYSPKLEKNELEKALGLRLRITQIASSYNAHAGVLRGLHYQLHPHTQGKLVECTRGAVLDVALDIRRRSFTFGNYITEVLSASKHNQLWVPPGCAHGYLALEPDTVFQYIVTAGAYHPPSERGVNPFDPDLNIPWILDPKLMDIKARDLNFPNLSAIPRKDLL